MISNLQKGATFKQNLDDQFEAKSFTVVREQIISLSKNSSLRKINALTIAKEIRKLLSNKQSSSFKFEEFKACLLPHIKKVDSASTHL